MTKATIQDNLVIDLTELNENELKSLYKCLWGMGRLSDSQQVDDMHEALTGEIISLAEVF